MDVRYIAVGEWKTSDSAGTGQSVGYYVVGGKPTLLKHLDKHADLRRKDRFRRDQTEQSFRVQSPRGSEPTPRRVAVVDFLPTER